MFKLIKEYFKKSKKLKYIYRCFELYKREDYRDFILQKGNTYNFLKIDHANKYGKSIIYYVNTGSYVSGFFAEHRRIIDLLAYADLFGFEPYIVYNSDYPYAEDHPILNTMNPFEYYFEQLSNTTKYDLDEKKIVLFKEADRRYIETGLRNTDNASSSYTMSAQDFDKYIIRASEISKKYIRFNEYTRNYLESNIKNILGNKLTLGVHARGGEWRNPVKNHPVAVPLEEHIDHVKKVMKEYGFEQIFLATDEKEAVEAFEKEFGEKVVYYNDTFRGESGTWLALAKNDRKNHKYLMGLEVLRDAETLAMCDGLIAGLSNISLYAQIEKKVLNAEYKYLCIDNKGIHSSGRTGRELYAESTRQSNGL